MTITPPSDQYLEERRRSVRPITEYFSGRTVREHSDDEMGRLIGDEARRSLRSGDLVEVAS